MNTPPDEPLNGSLPNPSEGETLSVRAGAGGPNSALSFLLPTTRPDSLGRLGHYEILQVLGQGGFGIVLRSFDDVLHRIVAIKVLVPEMAATSPARKRFLREARASAQVRHENVVQVYEVGEAPLPYLVMEFIPGETLQQRLDRTGPIEPAVVVRVGRQIAEGLAAAHETDLIHRDIKPANILLEGGQLKVKITDFGLARAADDASLTQSGIIAGTPMYMAPEQAKGEHLDSRADLFSLGTVLYQMAAGRPPFRANTTLAVLKRVAEDNPRPIQQIIPETPRWLCEIIGKLLAKNPEDRFQSAREVAEVLGNCEEQLAAGAEPQNFPRIPRRQSQPDGRRKWLAVGVVVLLLVLALTLTEWFRSRPQTSDRNQVPGPPQASNQILPPEKPKALSLKRTLSGHSGEVHAVVYSSNGKLLASGGTGSVRIWDAENGKLRHILRGQANYNFHALGFTPDSKAILTAQVSDDAPAEISIWNTDTGKVEGVLQGHTKGVFGLSVSPDGKTLVSGGFDRELRVWDLPTRQSTRVFPAPENGWIRSVVVSPTGKIAVNTGGQWSKTFLLDAEGTQIAAMGRPDGRRLGGGPLSFSPDGRRLAGAFWQEGKVTVWDGITGDEIASWRAHDETANGVAFSKDGNVLATAGSDDKVRLWEVKTQRQLAELSHDGAFAVAFSPDGKTLATTGVKDGRVKLWDIPAVLLEGTGESQDK